MNPVSVMLMGLPFPRKEITGALVMLHGPLACDCVKKLELLEHPPIRFVLLL
jgi:hypothetical protein